MLVTTTFCWMFLIHPAWMGPGSEGGLSTAERMELARRVIPSLVPVEFTLQYDKGEAPFGGGAPTKWRYYDYADLDDLVRQERPMTVMGVILSPTTILLSDPRIPPRFVKSISVRRENGAVAATIAGYAEREPAIYLQTDAPLAEARPLEFDPKALDPYYAVDAQRVNGEWRVGARPLELHATLSESGEPRITGPTNCVIVDARGMAVAVAMSGRFPMDDSWKGSPLDWPRHDAERMKGRLETLRAWADDTVLRVQLGFRSPKAEADEAWSSRYSSFGDDEEADTATELNRAGVLIRPDTVLVLASLKPSVTARLESIRVYREDHSEPVEATFAGSLKDYGGLLATLEQPLSGAVKRSRVPVARLDESWLWSADVRITGRQRVAYFDRERVISLDNRWEDALYPSLARDEDTVFLFDSEGALAALPLTRRLKLSVRDPWDSADVELTPFAYLAEALENPEASLDPNNTPLSAEEELRIAWSGVELQALDAELARANHVSDQTQDGSTGALVTFIHPGSPAEASDLHVGDLLLRMRVEGHPKPLDINLEDDGMEFMMSSFPWDQLDDIPSAYLDQVPKPWPPADSSFNKTLTTLGFGTKFTLEVYRDGAVISKAFEVTQGPPYFETAPRHESEALGLTVRDVTYEVARFFQRGAEDPGVIVSKVEEGGKADVAKVRPYEIITHVNDAPVRDVASFEQLLKDQTELRLSVRRMTKGRIVIIRP